LRKLLADVFAPYLKTKGFHWHISGPHFRDYHLLLDDLRATHALCAEHNDVATTSLIEVWIDRAERPSWFLIETPAGGSSEPANVFGTRINAG